MMANFTDQFIFFFALTLTLTLIPKYIAFDPQIALCGDADLAADGSHVDLSRSGLVLLRRPFAFVDSKLANPASFSTDFTFSDGISVVLVPEDLASKLSRVPPEKGFFIVANVSSMESEGKLRSWIDYDASSKRVEVRLAKMEEPRPYNAVMALAVDFPVMWRDRQVLMGLTSTNSNSRTSSVYSWNFRLRKFRNSVHSMPVMVNVDDESNKRKRVCALGILGGLIFATVCGALMAFSVLFLWAVVANVKQSQSESMGFRYERIDVVVEKDCDGVKK